MLWIFAVWDDLDADFRRFYRLDGIGDGDYGDLSGHRFIALVERVLSYGGATTQSLQRVHAQHQEAEREAAKAAEDDAKLLTMSDLIEF